MRNLPIIVLLLVPGLASAQALPDLAPREVEIRGELTISFPSLRRQPLIGFNPPPRGPDVDVRRMPYVEAYKQDSANLPQNQLQNPTTPRALPTATGEGFTGTFETGFGRYATRYALLEASLYSSSSSRWTIDGAYEGTTSYAPFGTDAAANGFSGGSRYTTSGRRISFGIEGSGSSDSYTLYGVDQAGSGGAQAAPTRTRGDLQGGLWFGSGSESSVGFRASLDGFSGRHSTDVFANTEDPRTERTDAGAEAGLRFSAGAFRVDGTAGTLTLDGASGRSVGHFDAGGGVRLRLGQATTLFFGGRVLGFEAQQDATLQNRRRALSYASPGFELESALAPNIRLEVTQRPGLGTTRPGELFRVQPFLADQVMLEPVVYPIDGVARLRGFWSSFQASVIATYRESPNWRVFEHQPGDYTGYARGLSTIRHTAARTMSLGGEVRMSPAAGVEARVGVRVQDGQLTDLDADMPYFSPWAMDGMVSVAFAQRRGLVQATTAVLGTRPRDASGLVDVPLYADLDLRLSYAVAGSALAVLELRNLLGETPYWFNYPEPPATVVLGFGWRW